MSRKIFTTPCAPSYVEAVLRNLSLSHVDLLEVYCKFAGIVIAQNQGGLSYQTVRGKTRFKFVYLSSAFCATAEGKTLEEAKNKAAAMALEQVTGVQALPLTNDQAAPTKWSNVSSFGSNAPSAMQSVTSSNPIAASSSFGVPLPAFGDQSSSSIASSDSHAPSTISNPIGAINEHCVRNRWNLPCFVDHGRTGGTDHQPIFMCSVDVDKSTFVGYGSSKKHAKHSAASQLAASMGLH